MTQTLAHQYESRLNRITALSPRGTWPRKPPLLNYYFCCETKRKPKKSEPEGSLFLLSLLRLI